MGTCSSKPVPSSSNLISSPWINSTSAITSNLIHSHIESVSCCLVSDDGKYIASAANDGTVILSCPSDSTQFSLSHIHPVHWPHDTPCPTEYDPDDISHFGVFNIVKLSYSLTSLHVLLTGSANNAVRSWDLKTGKLIHMFTNFQGSVLSLEVSPFDNSLFAFSNDPGSDHFPSILAICSVKGKELRRKNLGMTESKVVWSSANKLIVCGHKDGKPKIFIYDYVKDLVEKVEVPVKASVTSVDVKLIGNQYFAVRFEVDVASIDYHLPTWEHFYLFGINGSFIKSIPVISDVELLDTSFSFTFFPTNSKGIENLQNIYVGMSTPEGPVTIFKNQPDNDEELTEISKLSDSALLDLDSGQNIAVVSQNNLNLVKILKLSDPEQVLFSSDSDPNFKNFKNSSRVVCSSICPMSGKVILGFTDGSVFKVS
ncbi:hypothetical protein GEMRC1_000901 [Eukaryota sp. GEM-RC1]